MKLVRRYALTIWEGALTRQRRLVSRSAQERLTETASSRSFLGGAACPSPCGVRDGDGREKEPRVNRSNSGSDFSAASHPAGRFSTGDFRLGNIIRVAPRLAATSLSTLLSFTMSSPLYFRRRRIPATAQTARAAARALHEARVAAAFASACPPRARLARVVAARLPAARGRRHGAVGRSEQQLGERSGQRHLRGAGGGSAGVEKAGERGGGWARELIGQRPGGAGPEGGGARAVSDSSARSPGRSVAGVKLKVPRSTASAACGTGQGRVRDLTWT